MWKADGSIRPHWQTYLDALQDMSCEEFHRRHTEVLLLLREDGSTYNIHGEEAGERWMGRFDPIPFILSQEDWRRIQEALRQRMRLLQSIFHDLYGPSTLLREGVLPLEIVYGHPGFLHSCFRKGESSAPPLAFCAFDVARSTDGRWRVLRHLAKAPSGLGYAVEIRTAMARVFPEIIRDCKAYRLSHFFRPLRTGLAGLLPDRGRDARIVILTPGPKAQTYFEHAYLSAYLGFPLVQGDDLTVRDAAVWLKSIDSLERVDVILRFVEDIRCDPLELLSSSGEGIPGLTEAVRRGNVALANPLGAGLLDGAALLAYLPEVCRHLLGEELLLPGPAAWWCGSPEARAGMLNRPECYQWTEMAPGGELQSVDGESMSPEDLSRLKGRLQTSPERFVAAERMAPASAPSLESGTLLPRPAILRLFAAMHGDGCLVMPGGIARHVDPGAAFLDNPSPVTGSKDLWVLATEPQKHTSLWLQPGRVEESLRAGSILTSRAADNLFWVGRYAERAEGLARLLRTVLRDDVRRALSEDRSEREYFHLLLKSLTHITGGFPGFVGPGGHASLAAPEEELLAVVADPGRPGSLAATLQAMIRAAYAVRERWSKDTWRVLDDLEVKGRSLSHTRTEGLRALQHDLDQLVTALMAFAGLGMESMIREQGWLLLDIGRRIERALQFIDLFQSLLVQRHDGDNVLEHLVLEAALVTTENIITYRRRYRSYLQLETVLELLLLDGTNPRSLGYQLQRLQEHVAGLPRERAGYRLDEDERAILEASSRIRLAAPKWLTEKSHPQKYIHLENTLKKVSDLLTSASDILSKTYFSHIQTPQQLAPAIIEQMP